MRKKKEKKRLQRWLKFSLQKTMVGFERANAPRMSSHAIPFCLSLFAVENWALPKKLDKSDNDITFSLSLSFYYRKRRRFFGNTWIGRSVKKSEAKRSEGRGSRDDDEDERGERRRSRRERTHYVVPNELVYWYTFIDDPSCIAVIELVATETDPTHKLTIAQYGCGWTTMECFGKLLKDVEHTKAGDADDDLFGRDAWESEPLAFRCTDLVGEPAGPASTSGADDFERRAEY